MSDQVQNVRVKLTIDVDKNAPAMFQTFAREMNKANKKVNSENDKALKESAKQFKQSQERNYKNAGTAGLLGFNGFGSNLAGNANRAAGLERAGFANAASLMSKAAVPLAIAQQVIEKTAKVATIIADRAHDKYGTDDQYARRAFREVVPFGEKIQGAYDTLTGRAFKMEEARIQGQIGGARADARSRMAGFEAGYNPQQAGANALAGAYKNSSAVLPGVFDRSTAMGERSYREEQRVLPLRQASAKADRDSAVATAERVENQKELVKLEQRRDYLLKARKNLEEWSKRGSGPELQVYLEELGNVNKELSANSGTREQVGGRVVESKRAEARAKAESEKAAMRADLLGRADVLESRADTAAGTAGALGGMNPFQRQFAVQALKNAEQFGWDALPPEAQAAALSIGGERAQKLRQKAGMNSSAYAELGQFAPELAPGNPDELRKESDKLRRQAAQEEFDIDTKAAGQAAAAGKDFGRFVGGIINEQFENAKSEIIRVVKNGRNNN